MFLHAMRVQLSVLLCAIVLTVATIPSSCWAEDAEAPPAKPDRKEIEKVIAILEDTNQRDQLLKTLKTIALADQQQAAADNELKSVAAQTLNDIAKGLDRLTHSLTVITTAISNIPTVYHWVQYELSSPSARKELLDVALNLALTLGLGYSAFYLLRLLLNRFQKMIFSAENRRLLSRIFGLFFYLLIALLPIFAYGATAYLTLGVLSPHQKTRLVALAWVNGFLISHTIIAVCSLVLMPYCDRLRMIQLSGETSSYMLIWSKRLTYTIVYGYFALQAGLLLGLPYRTYGPLLQLLGLFVTMLLLVLIMQNRETVASQITQFRSEKTRDDSPPPDAEHAPLSDGGQPVQRARPSSLILRIAKVWHLLAAVYVILLYGVWALRIPGGFIFLFRATVLTVIILVVLRAILRLLLGLFKHSFKISDELKLRFPGLEDRANRYISTLHRVLRFGCHLLAVVAIFQAWGIDSFAWIISGPGRVLGSTLASVAGILVVAFLIWETANSLIENSLAPDSSQPEAEIRARTVTLLTVTRKALAIVLVLVSSLMVLAQLGINIAPLLAGAGVLGLAIGFGSQKLVQDVITGIFILLEDQMAVGDVVDLGGLAGVVEAVSIRTVRLRDVSGTVHTIPFSAISTVSNKTKDYSFYVLDIGVAYRENVDKVMEVIQEIGAELQQDPEYGRKILEPLEVLGVDGFADSAVMIKARIKTVPTKQWWVGREFNRRMKHRFDELDIEIPFPHQTIYFGVDKQGGAPAVRFAVEGQSTPPTS